MSPAQPGAPTANPPWGPPPPAHSPHTLSCSPKLSQPGHIPQPRMSPRGCVTTSPSKGLCHSAGGGSDPLPYKPGCAPAHCMQAVPQQQGPGGLTAPSAAPARCINGTGRCGLGQCLLSRSEAAEEDGCGAVGLLCAQGVLPVGKAAPHPASTTEESQSHVVLRDPQVQPSPRPTESHHHSTSLGATSTHHQNTPQGWGLHPVPTLGHSPQRELIPDSQSQPPLVQLES